MNTLTTFAGNAFRHVLEASWQAAVLGVLVLIVQLGFRKKLSPAWRYGLWLLVVTRLLMPISPQSAVSIFNLARVSPPQSTERRKRVDAASQRRNEFADPRVSGTSVADISPTRMQAESFSAREPMM